MNNHCPFCKSEIKLLILNTSSNNEFYCEIHKYYVSIYPPDNSINYKGFCFDKNISLSANESKIYKYTAKMDNYSFIGRFLKNQTEFIINGKNTEKSFKSIPFDYESHFNLFKILSIL